MQTFEAIQARRSIRDFKTDPLPEGAIERILEAAILSPSACNRQPWRFAVVSGAKRDEMIEVMQQAIEDRNAKGVETGSAKWTIQPMSQAPVTIFVHNPQGSHPAMAREIDQCWNEIADVQSIGAAIQNMILAATDLGLGSLWIADVWETYEELNEWLGEDAQMVAAVSFGLPNMEPPAASRKPMEEVARYIQ